MLSTPVSISAVTRVDLSYRGNLQSQALRSERHQSALLTSILPLLADFSPFSRHGNRATIPVVRMALPANDVSTRWFSE